MTPPRRKKSDQEPAVDTPIYLGNYSNGEMFHWQTERERRIREYVLKEAGERARRHGIDRRSFLSSAMGMALTLGALELGQGCSSSKSKRGMDPGGNFDATEPDDADACEAVLSPGDTFIFDVQTHHIDRVTSGNASFLNGISYAHCGKGLLGCLGFDEFLELVFLESDTTVAILTTVPFKPQDIPLSNTDIIRSMDAVNGAAKGTQRLLNHCAVLPNYDTENQLVMMEDVAKSRGVVGWKSYTSWRPSSTGPGYWLDDDVGRAFIEKARSLGPKIFSTHKGLPLTSSDPAYLDPQDIPRAAKLYPDCSFIVYHSAYHFGGSTEGPFERVGATARVGTNSPITSKM
ncbi:MAG: hypothetical protein KC417_13585, partial [Myxococcales bacterium]|nr:hypothetical protein [Myxococcales bacterium]